MAVRCDLVPARDLFPAVVLLVGEGHHFPVLAAIAVGVHDRIAGQVVLRANSPDLLGAGAVPIDVPAGERPALFFNCRADDLQASLRTPGREIQIERRGDNDDVVPLRPVPVNPLEGTRLKRAG